MAPKSKKSTPITDYASICANASGIAVQKAFNQLGPVNKFEDLLYPGVVPGAKELAAEQVFHMVEGWRYASAAVGAFLNNSHQTSLHFAYYAELRAALSLLSWSGIRVKQDAHYYVNHLGVRQIVKSSPTHKAVWGLWQHWTARPDAKSLFEDQIKLTTEVPLSEVLKGLQYVKPTKTIQGWGVDLAKVSDDHTARNISSYDAYWMKAPLTKTDRADLDLVLMLWKLLLPEEAGLTFDSALISYFVSEALPGMLGTDSVTDAEKIAALEIMAEEISTNTGLDADRIARRLSSTQYDKLPFELASSSRAAPRNVLCRCFFLLRLSMLATKTSMDLATNKSATLWLKHWFEHAGLWSASSDVEPYDISEDYSTAVNFLQTSGAPISELWGAPNIVSSIKLTRPEACMVWNVIE
ncbi:hypothetical protein V2J67_20015 [Pseudomonas alliivorans]|nr:hypothetical protein [Pseudomonas alliivorans]MEE4803465.1 hypothetical protein [Pseudomonas alliivorans]